DTSFGAPADGAGKVRARRGARAAGQDELLQGREARVPPLDQRVKARDLGAFQQRVPRDAELAAEVEEVLLHLRESRADVLRHVFGEHQAERGVELVDVAERLNAGVVLGYARAVAEAR